MKEISKFITNSKTKVLFVLLYAFCIVNSFFNMNVAVLEAFVTSIVLVIYLIERKKTDKNMRKYLENLSFNIESATHNSIMNSPFPMVIVRKNGEIIWYNNNFGDIIDKDSFLSQYIQDAFEGFVISNEENIVCDIKSGGKTFDAIGVCTKSDTYSKSDKKENDKNDSFEEIFVYYFVDTTDFTDLKNEHEQSRLVKGYIYIDNLDELTKSLPDSDRTGILSKIEKNLYDFTVRYNAILQRNDRDRYSFITEYRYFKTMRDEKFNVLKLVKDIEVTDMQFTLSIGVGVGADLHETESFAKSAIDLALGRGGDQAVVKEGTDVTYFGGNAREVEKRTKVRSRIVALYFKELLEKNERVIIMGHKNPDMDSLGAAMGISRIAKAYDKETFIVLDDTPNENVEALYKRLENNREYEGLFLPAQTAENYLSPKTVVVVVDCHRLSILPCPQLVEKADKKVLIDHHRKGADFISDTVLSFHEPYASSTCELVVEMLGYLDDKVKLRKAEAESLYAGILLDTQNFSVKTGVRTFEAASYLRKSGMEPISAKDFVKSDFETYIKVSEIVKSCEFYNNDIAIAKYYGEETNTIFIAQAADDLIDIKGIEAAFVIFKNKDKVTISARSNGKVNVQLVMEKLGGGGHQLVAGAQLADITVDKVVMTIKEILKEIIEEYKDEEDV